MRISDPKQLRYVIVDPGSTDGSRDIILARKERFAAIILEPDKGPADGLNRGFAHCDADILGYLNSDDRLAPGALDWVLNYFQRHPNVDIVMGAVRIIDGDGRAARRCRVPWQFTAQNFLDGTCLPLQQGTFFRRTLYAQTKGFNLENKTCWDTELLLDMVLAGGRLRMVPRILGDFRLYAGSISGSGRLNERYVLDGARMREKVLAAGYKPTQGPVLSLKKLACQLHPVRRSLEWLVR